MKLLAKLKIILYMGFRATLNFRKFSEILNSSNSLKMIPNGFGILSANKKYKKA